VVVAPVELGFGVGGFGRGFVTDEVRGGRRGVARWGDDQGRRWRGGQTTKGHVAAHKQSPA
jgi:hypothetical protein